MCMPSKRLLLSLCILSLGWQASVLAAPKEAKAKEPAADKSAPAIIEAKPDAMIVEFTYHPRSVYEIRTRSGMFTSLQVPAGEKILGFYLSDTVFWKFLVAKDGSRVFVRPSEPGRYNSGTMVTDKRVYELAFRSFETAEPYWYQRVQWVPEDDRFPGWGVYADPADALVQPEGGKVALTKPADGEAPRDWSVDLSKANFGYRVTGNQPFAPKIVLDDGVFTYMQFSDLQDMPAIFAFDEREDDTRLVDYVVRGNHIIVHRVAKGFLLKLGDATVVVERTR